MAHSAQVKTTLDKSPAAETPQANESPGYLADTEALRRVNQLWDYPAFSKERRVTKGLGRLKDYLRQRIRHFLLGEYFADELEFQAEVVRSLNQLARAIESKYWRMDDNYRASLHSLEKRVIDALHAEVLKLTNSLSQLQVTEEKHESDLQILDAVARGLERIVARFGRDGNAGTTPVDRAGKGEQAVDYSYLLLENRFRGDEQDVSRRLAVYRDLFCGESQPVLDIGAGRGELQKLFCEGGIPSYGLELDAAMVEHCAELGLDVRAEDGLVHLGKLEDGALGGVIAVQVVEHFPQRQLQQLFQLCAQKVRKGGKVVFETINTESMVALCKNYFRDPTHANPLHPETLRFLVELAGLRVLEMQQLSPFPDAVLFQTIPTEDYMTPRWKNTIVLLNHNFRILNDLLFGYQDYYIVAEVE